ncbi:F-box/FBD/LRR-repeat protein At1g80470 isoform X1 [Oryza sativa Japonica Group]|uniref:F-box/FBD/LRR-repeat protein At1g80470 isoform X1 n=1 Tax=Oryza sativa subsp. japonica TaxID=39947 RepID=UPI0007753DE5|nr:putative F-box/FBD/LRR-repeat protein At5g44960 isoform X2 [Oryza sativa Japonica Group]
MSNKRMRPTVLEASTYDFISSLPDESLQHILCFMTTREAIQTCVLSTRWRHIWKSVQCLEIKASEFTSKMGFVNFMDNLDEDEDEDDSFRSRQNEVLKRDLRRCQSFNNLKKLSVDDWYVDVDLSALIYLLRCSPIIEKLTLHLGMIEGLAWEQWMSYPQEETPDLSFSCERLKKVKIICVQDDKRVPAIVNAILANANSLPEIVIKPYKRFD